MLGGRQAVAAAPGLQIGLFDPVANRLPRELELRREVVYAATRSSKLDNLLPEVRWVGVGVFSGHGWIFLRQAESIHGTGPASIAAILDALDRTMPQWRAAAERQRTAPLRFKHKRQDGRRKPRRWKW